MMDIKVVAFDCDGVLFDTTQANTIYYNRLLEHFGKPEMTPEQFRYVHMHTVDNAIAHLFDDEKTRKAANEYRRKNVSYLPFIKYMKIEPYLKPLLKKLKPSYHTAIATNRKGTMNRILSEHGIEKYFDLVVTACDVKRPKPCPDSLVNILKHFKVEPRQVIYIGDSELDEKAAKAAGIPFVAYGDPSLSADFHIKNLKEVEEIL